MFQLRHLLFPFYAGNETVVLFLLVPVPIHCSLLIATQLLAIGFQYSLLLAIKGPDDFSGIFTQYSTRVSCKNSLIDLFAKIRHLELLKSILPFSPTL